MNVREADILFKDTVAGTLTETASGGTRFTYGTDWKEPIACCLPVERREHEWGQGLHPFFQHLGAEGWLRERQARSAHIAQEDDLGLLLRYGADCIGAVSVRSKTPIAETHTPTEELSANQGRTVSGVQKKLLVVKKGTAFHPAEKTGLAPYIAKFNSEALPTLVRNEALTLRWTTTVLGESEVNRFTTGQVAGQGDYALIVTRFDRTEEGQKLRLEDFAQILVKARGTDYAGKYDASYEDVAAVIKNYSARPNIDLGKFFQRLVVFVLVGNCDGHLKNFSLLETPTGLRLSPVYDVLNTAMYDSYDRNLALRIDGTHVQIDAVNKTLLEAFGRSIGLPQKAIDQTFKGLQNKVRRAEKHITPPAAESPDGFIHRYAEIVRAGCLRIFEE